MSKFKIINRIKCSLRPHYHNLRWSIHRLLNIAPSLPVSAHSYKLVTLGTDYGGWTFVDDVRLNNSSIISCGLGEDASFDIEAAEKYGAVVFCVDPTPRAIQHFNEITSRIGEKNSKDYMTIGAQTIDCYDLSKITESQLILCEKAIWNQNTHLKFFAPPDPTHVSFSIINFQNNYLTNTSSITVEAITIDRLISDFDIKNMQILKLDIEGAEIEVILDMLSKGICPNQLLVEYDELLMPSKKSKLRVESAHKALINAGYVLIYRDFTNFTYIFNEIH